MDPELLNYFVETGAVANLASMYRLRLEASDR